MTDEPDNKRKFFHVNMDMGQLMIVVGGFIGLVGQYYGLDSRMTLNEKQTDYRLTSIEHQIAKQNEIQEASIRRDEQVKYIAEEMRAIKSQLKIGKK